MKIHEYQAKEVLAALGVPTPEGHVATTPKEAREIADQLGGQVVIKAQVHVGGRGKAGGVKLAADKDEAEQTAGQILSMDIKGEPVRKVLVAAALDIAAEFYLGVTIDRRARRPIVMVSDAGGVDIEEVARETPEKIHRLHVSPHTGLMPFQARQLAFAIQKDRKAANETARILLLLYKAFAQSDASLAEINPLVTTTDGEVIALDAKMVIDDNGLFRQSAIEDYRDEEAEGAHEGEARRAGLSYVKLDGNIGCMVNGAGLAMATMDVIKHYGGEPANFLDIGGSSSPEKVITAMNIILSDPNVKAIFINIFGGITRCDDVANGLVAAFEKSPSPVPVVIRLTGTNEDEARKILEKINLPSTTSMDEGVRRALEAAA